MYGFLFIQNTHSIMSIMHTPGFTISAGERWPISFLIIPNFSIHLSPLLPGIAFIPWVASAQGGRGGSMPAGRLRDTYVRG
jgi:hypothetical protein